MPRDGGTGCVEEDHRRGSFETEALPELAGLRARALRLAGGDEMRAGDLVQETMLRALSFWDSYERGTNVGAWLMTILRNVFISDYRRRQRAPLPFPVDETFERASLPHVDHPDPECQFFDGIIDREVREAIGGLSEPMRLPFLLSCLEDLSHAEIGGLLDLPVGTVKSRLHRARRRLRSRLHDYGLERGYLRRECGPADLPAAARRAS